MESFFNELMAFPTVIFTVLMGLVLIYWLLVLAGALGMPEGDLDLGIDADVDAGAEGAGEGVVASLMHALKLGGMPLTVVLSLLVFFMWIFTFLAGRFLRPLLGDWSSVVVGLLVILPAAFLLGLLLTSVAARPLAPLFVVHQAPSRKDLTGRICEITSGSVNATFGQAELADGGAGLLLHVRCPKENELKRGDLAVIYDYEQKNDVYDVEPVDWLAPGEKVGGYEVREVVDRLRKQGKI